MPSPWPVFDFTLLPSLFEPGALWQAEVQTEHFTVSSTALFCHASFAAQAVMSFAVFLAVSLPFTVLN